MNGDNGHDPDPEAQALEQAERELNTTLEKADMDKVFSTPVSTDNVKLLMTPGDNDPKNLYMRADIPDTATALAFAIRESRCQEHGDTEGTLKILKMIAALVGVQGKRAILVSDTMIGERHNAGMRRGMGDWIRDKAGIGGDKE